MNYKTDTMLDKLIKEDKINDSNFCDVDCYISDFINCFSYLAK